ncbi:hypothetical protein D3C87_2181500 [compost metagenome]
MKMCSISVEPMPSRISQPKCRVKRSPMSRGKASPADVHTRIDTCSRGGRSGDASMLAYKVGTP